jgi:peptidyl-dipeptidase A
MASMSLLSCSGKFEPQKPRVTSKDELYVFLDSLERQYEDACYEIGLANWNSYSKEGAYDLDAAKANFAKIFLDTTTRNIIEQWRERSGSLADEELARRLELWYRCFIGGAIYADAEISKQENVLQQRITDFQLMFEGTPTTRAKVSNALRTERNQKRRHKLWSVTSQLSQKVSDDLLKLVKLRNAKAKEFGFPNYYSLSLHLQAIDEEWLIETLRMLEEETRPAFEEFIKASKKKLRVKEIGPWDFDIALKEAASLPDKYFRPESVFSVIHKFEKGIGFDVDSLPIKEVVKDIPYGGLSLAIKIPTDSRFLVNPTKGKGFYSVAFHEYGHSLKAVHVDVSYPILKGYEWIPGAQCAAYEEGVADLHGEFTDDSLWLTRFTKVKPKELNRYLEGKKLPALFRLRRLLKDFSIEYEMYKNPEADMAEVERAMFKKYLLVDLNKNEPHQFAASIWYTSYPCYYQNYILAAMIATQLQEALTDQFGEEKISDSTVAEWMRDYLYKTGELEEWTKRIRNASGKSLETGAYLRKLGVETMQLIHKD